MNAVMRRHRDLPNAIGDLNATQGSRKRLLVLMWMQKLTIAQFGSVRRLDLPAIGIMIPAGVTVTNGDVEPPCAAQFACNRVDHHRPVRQRWRTCYKSKPQYRASQK